MDASIGIECLFSPENGHNVNNVVSGATVQWLLPGPQKYDEKLLIEKFEQRKLQYAIRSDIVHGKLVSAEDLRAHSARFTRTLRRCLQLALFDYASQPDGVRLFECFCKRLPTDYAAKVRARQ